MATHDKLDKCVKDTKKTGLLLTKQTDNRNDCAKTGNQYVVRARRAILGYFGPDATEYAQVGGIRASERKTPGRKPKAKTTAKAA